MAAAGDGGEGASLGFNSHDSNSQGILRPPPLRSAALGGSAPLLPARAAPSQHARSLLHVPGHSLDYSSSRGLPPNSLNYLTAI